jgi:hypothetical protein
MPKNTAEDRTVTSSNSCMNKNVTICVAAQYEVKQLHLTVLYTLNYMALHFLVTDVRISSPAAHMQLKSNLNKNHCTWL